jgi:flagellar hook assembly protein FlgD
MNYPNPFTDGTSFLFDHNQFNAQLEVEISIYDIMGHLLKTIGPQQLVSEGYHVQPIYWDGTSENGTRISRGIYIYSITVDNNKMSKQTLSGKLIVFK